MLVFTGDETVFYLNCSGRSLVVAPGLVDGLMDHEAAELLERPDFAEAEVTEEEEN